MADIARMSVDLTVDMPGFEAGLKRADSALATTTASMNRNVVEFDRNLKKVGGGRLAGLQNAGYQIGDFAVQVASGQNALIAFTQQGTQLISGFGPWGAVIGAAGAVVGALATYLLNAKDEAKEFDLEIGGLSGGVDGLRGVVESYIKAIDDTASAQSAATASIVADTRAEFEAKRDLLELEIKRQEAAQAERQARIGSIESDLTPPELIDPATARGSSRRGIGARNEARLADYNERAGPLRDELKKLQAEAVLAQIAIDKATEAVGTSFDDLVQVVRGEESARRGRRGGRSSSGDALEKAIAATRRRTEDLQAELEAVGKTAEEQARLNLTYEAARLELDLLTKAKQSGNVITAEEASAVSATVTEYTRATEALIAARAEQERTDEAQKAATDSAKAQAQTLSSMTNSLAGVAEALVNGENVAGAFVRALAEIAAQALRAELALDGVGKKSGGGIFAAIGSALAGTGGGANSGMSLASQYASYGAGRARASGGPVVGGMPYLVNERTPRSEIFVPSVSGGVLNVPQAQAALRGAGGGQTVNVTMPIDARGAQIGVAEQIEARMARFVNGPDLIRAINQANGRGRA